MADGHRHRHRAAAHILVHGILVGGGGRRASRSDKGDGRDRGFVVLNREDALGVGDLRPRRHRRLRHRRLEGARLLHEGVVGPAVVAVEGESLLLRRARRRSAGRVGHNARSRGDRAGVGVIGDIRREGHRAARETRYRAGRRAVLQFELPVVRQRGLGESRSRDFNARKLRNELRLKGVAVLHFQEAFNDGVLYLRRDPRARVGAARRDTESRSDRDVGRAAVRGAGAVGAAVAHDNARRARTRAAHGVVKGHGRDLSAHAHPRAGGKRAAGVGIAVGERERQRDAAAARGRGEFQTRAPVRAENIAAARSQNKMVQAAPSVAGGDAGRRIRGARLHERTKRLAFNEAGVVLKGVVNDDLLHEARAARRVHKTRGVPRERTMRDARAEFARAVAVAGPADNLVLISHRKQFPAARPQRHGVRETRHPRRGQIAVNMQAVAVGEAAHRRRNVADRHHDIARRLKARQSAVGVAGVSAGGNQNQSEAQMRDAERTAVRAARVLAADVSVAVAGDDFGGGRGRHRAVGLHIGDKVGAVAVRDHDVQRLVLADKIDGDRAAALLGAETQSAVVDIENAVARHRHIDARRTRAGGDGAGQCREAGEIHAGGGLHLEAEGNRLRQRLIEGDRHGRRPALGEGARTGDVQARVVVNEGEGGLHRARLIEVVVGAVAGAGAEIGDGEGQFDFLLAAADQILRRDDLHGHRRLRSRRGDGGHRESADNIRARAGAAEGVADVRSRRRVLDLHRDAVRAGVQSRNRERDLRGGVGDGGEGFVGRQRESSRRRSAFRGLGKAPVGRQVVAERETRAVVVLNFVVLLRELSIADRAGRRERERVVHNARTLPLRVGGRGDAETLVGAVHIVVIADRDAERRRTLVGGNRHLRRKGVNALVGAVGGGVVGDDEIKGQGALQFEIGVAVRVDGQMQTIRAGGNLGGGRVFTDVGGGGGRQAEGGLVAVNDREKERVHRAGGVARVRRGTRETDGDVLVSLGEVVVVEVKGDGRGGAAAGEVEGVALSAARARGRAGDGVVAVVRDSAESRGVRGVSDEDRRRERAGRDAASGRRDHDARGAGRALGRECPIRREGDGGGVVVRDRDDMLGDGAEFVVVRARRDKTDSEGLAALPVAVVCQRDGDVRRCSRAVKSDGGVVRGFGVVVAGGRGSRDDLVADIKIGRRPGRARQPNRRRTGFRRRRRRLAEIHRGHRIGDGRGERDVLEVRSAETGNNVAAGRHKAVQRRADSGARPFRFSESDREIYARGLAAEGDDPASRGSFACRARARRDRVGVAESLGQTAEGERDLHLIIGRQRRKFVAGDRVGNKNSEGLAVGVGHRGNRRRTETHEILGRDVALRVERNTDINDAVADLHRRQRLRRAARRRRDARRLARDRRQPHVNHPRGGVGLAVNAEVDVKDRILR